MESFTYAKAQVDIEMLTSEIKTGLVGNTLSHIEWDEPDSLIIYFTESLSSEESIELNDIVLNHSISYIGEKKFFKVVFNADGDPINETWYNTDNGDGTYSIIVEEKSYTYTSPNVIESHTIKTFWANGTLKQLDTCFYYTDEYGNMVLKKV